jgi:hypothetical protein
MAKLSNRSRPGVIGWFFEDRRTGHLTVVQFPNIELWVFLAAAVLSRFVVQRGTGGNVLRLVSDVALGLWALDEIVRGVNPFRRVLGAVIGAAITVTLVARH